MGCITTRGTDSSMGQTGAADAQDNASSSSREKRGANKRPRSPAGDPESTASSEHSGASSPTVNGVVSRPVARAILVCPAARPTTPLSASSEPADTGDPRTPDAAQPGAPSPHSAAEAPYHKPVPSDDELEVEELGCDPAPPDPGAGSEASEPGSGLPSPPKQLAPPVPMPLAPPSKRLQLAQQAGRTEIEPLPVEEREEDRPPDPSGGVDEVLAFTPEEEDLAPNSAPATPEATPGKGGDGKVQRKASDSTLYPAVEQDGLEVMSHSSDELNGGRERRSDAPLVSSQVSPPPQQTRQSPEAQRPQIAEPVRLAW
eukprot:TRINITY_DN15830_c0_g2_i1.p2 TRINITY_DN15830_c0_g2~~TRINITY_DN15830_c0_g2_i1.p2  ORF type:complete len:315 (+),score=41.86 TRINITY_DN15830_c0_g2_i1:147-1091(+)